MSDGTRNHGLTLPLTMAATALLAVLALTGFEMLPSWNSSTEASLRLVPSVSSVTVGDTFTALVLADASTPVNVFSGELTYNTDVIQIDGIDYNTSIADLWAEKPWYENGDGTMNFGGGTTQRGGFTGTATLITITIRAVGAGDAALNLHNMRILKYDGLGTDAELTTPIDTVLTVIDAPAKKNSAATVAIIPTNAPSPDLNNDGRISLADASILMLNLLSTDPRYDLNGDGEVTNRDLELITF